MNEITNEITNVNIAPALDGVALLAVHALTLRRAAERGESLTVPADDALVLVDAIGGMCTLAERAATLAQEVDAALARRARRRASRAAPALPAALEGVSDDVFIEVLGPSWSAMKPTDRERYGPAESPIAMAAAKMANMTQGRKLREAPRGASTPATWTPPTSWRDADALHRRVCGYLATVGTVGEGARNHTAYKVAAQLVRDFALRADVAWAYLSEWNTGNIPPLGSRELRACLASAAKHGRRTIGAGLER